MDDTNAIFLDKLENMLEKYCEKGNELLIGCFNIDYKKNGLYDIQKI